MLALSAGGDFAPAKPDVVNPLQNLTPAMVVAAETPWYVTPIGLGGLALGAALLYRMLRKP